MQATEYVTRQTIAGIDHRAMEEAIDRCAGAQVVLVWSGRIRAFGRGG